VLPGVASLWTMRGPRLFCKHRMVLVYEVRVQLFFGQLARPLFCSNRMASSMRCVLANELTVDGSCSFCNTRRAG